MNNNNIMEDPENVQDILTQIRSTQRMSEIFELIDKTYPHWIVKVVDGFSFDYKFLTQNWKNICSEKKIQKAKILIVSGIHFESDKHLLIRTFSELLTCAGFVVRDVRDLRTCDNCGLAIPTIGMYNTLEKMNVDIPKMYTQNCSTC